MDNISNNITFKLIVGFYKAHRVDEKPTTIILVQSLSSTKQGVFEQGEETFTYSNISQYEAILKAIGSKLSHLPELVGGINIAMPSVTNINIEVVTTERAMFKAVNRVNKLVDFMSSEYEYTPQQQLDIYWKVEPRVPKTFAAMNNIALSLYEVKDKMKITFNTISTGHDKAKLRELSVRCKDEGLMRLMKKNNVVNINKTLEK